MKVFHLIAIAIVCTAVTLFSGFAQAQPPGAAPFASVKSAVVEPASVKPGGKAVLVITLVVNEGFHINANKPDDDMSVPTVLTLTPPKTPGIKLSAPGFPAAKSLPVSYSPKPIKGYDGTVVIHVPIGIQKTVKPATVKLTGTLRAQGCNATTCFPPQSFPITASLTIAGGKN